MSELAQAMKRIRNLGLNIIKYPSGKFGFVGRVPYELAYIHSDGHTPTMSEFRDIAQSSNPAMTCKKYGIKTLVFDTENEARFYAARAGFEVIN